MVYAIDVVGRVLTSLCEYPV